MKFPISVWSVTKWNISNVKWWGKRKWYFPYLCGVEQSGNIANAKMFNLSFFPSHPHYEKIDNLFVFWICTISCMKRLNYLNNLDHYKKTKEPEPPESRLFSQISPTISEVKGLWQLDKLRSLNVTTRPNRMGPYFHVNHSHHPLIKQGKGTLTITHLQSLNVTGKGGD